MCACENNHIELVSLLLKDDRISIDNCIPSHEKDYVILNFMYILYILIYLIYRIVL